MNSVAAKGDGAGGCTGIFSVGVTVIASLFTIPEHAVAADSSGAGIETVIGVDGVTVITLLTLLHGAVTAARRLADRRLVGDAAGHGRAYALHAAARVER